jgi:BTB/POZ domain-containing protein KCTD7/14
MSSSVARSGGMMTTSMVSSTPFPKIVRLSVGGVIFETSIETLCADPNSMLAAMFSGRHNVNKDEDGRYFIDRDGTHFRYILNYLRDGNTYIPFDN